MTDLYLIYDEFRASKINSARTIYVVNNILRLYVNNVYDMYVKMGMDGKNPRSANLLCMQSSVNSLVFIFPLRQERI